MSKADAIFKKNARYILEHGTSTEGQAVRPHWPDGTPAYTIKQFGVAEMYDLQEEFPAITVRKTGLKSAMDEMLWIYQKKSNNVNELNSHIWDEWADEKGSIGKAYGFQAGQRFLFKKFKPSPDAVNWVEVEKERRAWERKEEERIKGLPSACTLRDELWMDQVDAVLYQLKYEPFGRRIQISLWNVAELNEMHLQPCAWNVVFNVTDDKREDGKLTLNAVLNQRSNDMLAANNWNTAQYAILLMMFAQASGMVAGKLLHVIADQHIYDRHIDIMKELIEREEYPAPVVKLNPEVTDFYKFTTDDLIVEKYQAGSQVKFEVAI